MFTASPVSGEVNAVEVTPVTDEGVAVAVLPYATVRPYSKLVTSSSLLASADPLRLAVVEATLVAATVVITGTNVNSYAPISGGLARVRPA